MAPHLEYHTSTIDARQSSGDAEIPGNYYVTGLLPRYHRMLLDSISDARRAAFIRALSWEGPVRIATSRALAFNELGVALERTDDVERVEVVTDDGTVSELNDQFLSRTHLGKYTQNETLAIRSQLKHLMDLIILTIAREYFTIH